MHYRRGLAYEALQDTAKAKADFEARAPSRRALGSYIAGYERDALSHSRRHHEFI